MDRILAKLRKGILSISLWALLAASVARAAAPPAKAGDEGELSAANMLNEAIWWPGNFSQICRGDDTIGPFEAPYLPGYGTLANQDYYLSQATIAKLRAHREQIVPELVRRLEAFHWDQFLEAPQPAPRVVKHSKAELAKLDPSAAGPGPWQPENALALGATMLRIIKALEAAEALPELLRLEAELDQLNHRAIDMAWKTKPDAMRGEFKRPATYVPPIYVGVTSSRDDELSDWIALGRPDGEKPSAATQWLEWKGRIFDNIIFQREILGVCLSILDAKTYPPLRTSLVGRLRALGLRRDARRARQWHHIQSEADLTPEWSQKGYRWDVDLGVALYKDAGTVIPGSDRVRGEARQLVEAFVQGKNVPQLTDGEKLLESTIEQPGDFNQMCAAAPAVYSDVPLPGVSLLAYRHHSLDARHSIMLQAYRDLVMPVLVQRWSTFSAISSKANRLLSSSGSGQTSKEFGSLMNQITVRLNAVECLPDILRLEEELHAVIVKAETDPVAVVPDFFLDSAAMEITRSAVPFTPAGRSDAPKKGEEASAEKTPGSPKEPSPEEKARQERHHALFVCKIYQRELLGMIKTMLLNEDYPPMKNSALVAAEKLEGRRQLEELLKQERYQKEVPAELLPVVDWYEGEKRYKPKEKASLPAQLPYTESIRDQIRRIANDFLREVPPERRRAGEGMPMPWLSGGAPMWDD